MQNKHYIEKSPGSKKGLYSPGILICPTPTFRWCVIGSSLSSFGEVRMMVGCGGVIFLVGFLKERISGDLPSIIGAILLQKLCDFSIDLFG